MSKSLSICIRVFADHAQDETCVIWSRNQFGIPGLSGHDLVHARNNRVKMVGSIVASSHHTGVLPCVFLSDGIILKLLATFVLTSLSWYYICFCCISSF